METVLILAAIVALLLDNWRANADEEAVIEEAESVDVPEAKVVAYARAIAVAEGFGVAGAIPTVRHNPGDLADVVAGRVVVRTYESDDAGWQALYRQVRAMLTGKSRLYSPDDTFAGHARTYTGEAAYMNWARNVATVLGVTPDTVVSDWMAS